MTKPVSEDIKVGDYVVIIKACDIRDIGLVGKVVFINPTNEYCVVEYDPDASAEESDGYSRSPYVMGNGTPVLSDMEDVRLVDVKGDDDAEWTIPSSPNRRLP